MTATTTLLRCHCPACPNRHSPTAHAGLSVATPRDELLLLGRQDYLVRSVRVDSKAETWNATFSRMVMMSPRDSSSIRDFLATGAAPPLGGARAAPPAGAVGVPGAMLARRQP